MILQRFGKKAKGHTVPAAQLCVHHPWQCRLPWLIRAYSSSPEWLCVGVGSVLGSQQGILPLALHSLLLYKSQNPPQPFVKVSWELAAKAHKSTCELRTPAEHAHSAVQLTFCGPHEFAALFGGYFLTCLTESLPCHSSDSGASCEWLWKEPCMQCSSCRLHLEPSQEDLSETQQQKAT